MLRAQLSQLQTTRTAVASYLGTFLTHFHYLPYAYRGPPPDCYDERPEQGRISESFLGPIDSHASLHHDLTFLALQAFILHPAQSSATAP